MINHLTDNLYSFVHFFPNKILGGRKFELVSGFHQYPFSFVLPTKIPSSFQTEMLAKFGYGYVRYSIKVVLKRSSRQNNSETTCHIPFTVTSVRSSIILQMYLPFFISVKGALKPSWKPNYEHVIAFTVRSIVDLNLIPKAAVRFSFLKLFDSCFCFTFFFKTNFHVRL